MSWDRLILNAVAQYSQMGADLVKEFPAVLPDGVKCGISRAMWSYITSSCSEGLRKDAALRILWAISGDIPVPSQQRHLLHPHQVRRLHMLRSSQMLTHALVAANV